MSHSEAARRARLEFGSPDKHAEACRESRGLRLVDELAADLRYGLRQLRRAPASRWSPRSRSRWPSAPTPRSSVSWTRVLIKTLPVAEPQQCGSCRGWGRATRRHSGTAFGYNGGGKLRGPSELAGTSFSYLTCDAIRRNTTSFSNVLCLGHIEQVNLSVGGRAMLGRGQIVSGNFFRGLPLGRHIGRVIGPDDDRTGQAPVAVLGYGFWERALGGDSGVLGRSLTVNGVAVTIVGVAARGFTGLQPGEVTDVFLPLVPLQPAFYSEPDMLSSPRYWNWLVVGRLKAGADPEHARQESQQLLRQELMARPTSPLRSTCSARGHGVRSRLRSTARVIRQPACVLGLIVGAVLLIACANIAGCADARERAAASLRRACLRRRRGRLVRQLRPRRAARRLGGAAGLALAFAPARAAGGAQRIAGPADARHVRGCLAIVYSGSICAFTALACGVLPAPAPTRGTAAGVARAASTNTTAAARFWSARRWWQFR
jgi:hypothetical protein